MRINSDRFAGATGAAAMVACTFVRVASETAVGVAESTTGQLGDL